MGEILFLVKQADEALLESQLLLNKDLIGSMREVIWSDCKQELDEAFGKTNTERKNK